MFNFIFADRDFSMFQKGKFYNPRKKENLQQHGCKLFFSLLVISTCSWAESQHKSSIDRFWFGAEYLSWSFKDAPEPVPLVTSGSLSAVIPGAIGQVGTQVAMGDKPIDTGVHSGGRFTMGYWFDDNRQYGIEGNYFFLSPNHSNQSISTSGLPGSPTLAVPIFDISGFTSGKSSGESVYVLPGPFSTTSPGFAGTFAVNVTNRLQGAELNGLFKTKEFNNFRFDLFTGLRWLQYWEKLAFDVNTTGVPSGSTAGQFFNSHDMFCAENNFYGFNFGLRAKYDNSKFYGLVSAHMSLGNMNESTNIEGQSSTSNGTIFFPVSSSAGRPINGGIFAQHSNIGHHSENVFAAIPELDLKVGYHLLKNLNVIASYSALYISNLAHPGNLINRYINTTRTALADASRASGSGIAATGPTGPNFKFNNSDFWAQGISFGLEMNF